MTIEQKALELDLISRVIAAYHTTRTIEDAHKRVHSKAHIREAFDRLAEADKARHAAEMREQAERVSSIAASALAMYERVGEGNCLTAQALRGLILPAPDPLAECSKRPSTTWGDRKSVV